MIIKLLVLLSVILSIGCTTLPTHIERTPSQAFQDSASTTLGQLVAEPAREHTDESGFMVLDSGKEAFTARIALADTVERSLDAQYYIWNADTTGRLLADRLLRAAERGVRVRLLLDDYGVGNKDNALYALDTHPQIEVRVYNPFRAGFRSGLRKWTTFGAGFSRLNRRMHSKTFIADGGFAIVGGRNIGDEYFDARADMNHRDRDLLATGPVVRAIGEQFDAMWNSDWAIPITALMVFTLSEEAVRERYRLLRAFADTAANRPYPLPDTRQDALQLLRSRLDGAIWAPAEFIYNPPAITAGDEINGAVIANTLRELAKAAKTDILIESAYFIVTDETLELVEQLIDRDVKIRALTNSLSTTDVWLIHSGYTRNREEVIRSGVKLYEFRPDAASCRQLVENDHHDCKDFKFSLHAKSVVFDRRQVFVGSFNLNPRSRLLNTETALVVHSPVLAEQIARDIEENLQPENSWQVVINDAGRLEWHARTDGVTSVVSHEPATGMWTRFKSYIFSFFPVEKYL